MHLALREVARVYDLRARILWGTGKSFELTIDPVLPTLLALSTSPGSFPGIAGTSRVAAGGTATVTFGLPRRKGTSSDVAVLRVELVDPRGEVVPSRSVNVLLRDATVAKRFDFATHDSPGRWQIRASDVLTGKSASKDLEVARE